MSTLSGAANASRNSRVALGPLYIFQFAAISTSESPPRRGAPFLRAIRARPRPEDRARLGDMARERRARLRADVETEPALGQLVVTSDPRLRIRAELARGDDVGRQDDVERQWIVAAQLLRHLAADKDRVRL